MQIYKELITQTSEIGMSLLLPEAQEQLRKQEQEALELLDSLQYVKVPIVGLFDAGKTSLINSLTAHKGLLPVDIIPKTSIPCEIYAAVNEDEQRAEVFRGKECVYEGSIEGYGDFDKLPGDVGKVYVDSDFVRSTQKRGLILVDMPGTDSGIREHNDAIVRYVQQGTLFAQLISAKNGALSSSDIAFIKELKQYGLHTAVFISKTDLVTAEGLEDIREYINSQYQDVMETTETVGQVCAANDDVTAFINWINTIDIEAVNKKRFSPIITSYVAAMRLAIITRIQLLKDDMNFGDIDSKIAELEGQLCQVNEMLSVSIENADTPEKSTQDILDWVENDMRLNSRLVAESILSNSVTQVNETIMSIVRPALLNAFAEERKQFVEAMRTELDTVTRRLLEGIEIPSDLIDDMISENADIIVGSLQLLAERLSQSGNPWGATVGLVLRLLAEWVPDILREIFGGQERAIRKIEQKFIGPFTSQILNSLYSIVLQQVKEQQEHILNGVRLKYAGRVAQIMEVLQNLHEQRVQGENDFSQQIAILDIAISQLDSIDGSLR
ncbi:dynamin family protein [Bacteroides uniformis]|jgi:Dynamin family.|uniref:Dynamin family protein n=1 Tax=Bacteroides uniformis TaxID=820 RepID=A0AAW6GHS3_BACUN|nr:dynamin family protein [Bacteroides uniformis]MDC1856282.1 dynamin family protein [Bacteroides uniformis]MDC1860597.1 dynamin family protein [Bacteroides uniformis]MDC1873373.1 dynamin family protein [Bacteroides uniformis]